MKRMSHGSNCILASYPFACEKGDYSKVQKLVGLTMARTKFIHTVDFDMACGVASTANSFPILLDLSSELTRKTNKMQRQGQSYYVGGIDIVVQNTNNASFPSGNPGTYSQVSGEIRYLTPTKGRCAAYKMGYDQWRQALRNAGIKPNRFQDFRVTPLGEANYSNMVSGVDDQSYPAMVNLSTLDDIRPLACSDNVSAGYELFTTHNNQQAYTQPTAAQQSPVGLTRRIDSGGGPIDFVTDEEVLFTGWSNEATMEYTSIPFVASWDDQNNVYSFHWDPSPNAYLSIMCGWLEVVLEDVVTDGDSGLSFPLLDMKISVDILGTSKMYTSSKKKKTSKRKSRRRSRK